MKLLALDPEREESLHNLAIFFETLNLKAHRRHTSSVLHPQASHMKLLALDPEREESLHNPPEAACTHRRHT